MNESVIQKDRITRFDGMRQAGKVDGHALEGTGHLFGGQHKRIAITEFNRLFNQCTDPDLGAG
jgi:hypothetical protein